MPAPRFLCALLVIAASIGLAVCPTAAALRPRSLSLSAGPLALKLAIAADGATSEFRLTDSRSGRTWTAATKTETEGALLSAQAESTDTLRLEIAHPETSQTFIVKARLSAEELAFEIEPGAQPEARFRYLNYPPVFRTDLGEEGRLLFCDRNGGLALPQDDANYRRQTLAVYGNTQALDMPWIGVIDQQRGDGLQLRIDTPTEAAIRLASDTQGRSWPQTIWFASKSKFGYARRAALRPTPAGGYVAQAKAYRAHAASAGLISPLQARVAARPRVDWLRGAPIVWGVPGAEFARQAAAHGIRRGVFNGHGRMSGADARTMTELGFLCGEYDSYTDIEDGPLGKQKDNVERTAYRDADGSIRKGWRTLDGTQFYFRSSALARAAAQAIVPPILASTPYTARFIDVSASMNLYEDFHPEHSFDRRADLGHRIRLLSYFQELGLVVGAEHTKDWAVPCVEYTEGPMSGPYWWETKVGHLQPLRSRAEMDTRYLKYANNPALRVPLWDLVYHDCIVSTWYWGDSNDYLYNIAPELSDYKDLANIVHGTPPLMWADHLGYGWDRHRARFLQTYYHTCRFAEQVAFRELLSHERLSADGTVQLSRFAGGGVAVVNFGAQPAPLPVALATELGAAAGGEPPVLAPGGFVAQAAGFRQSRLLEGGSTVTRISSPDFSLLESAGAAQAPGLSGSGVATVFREGNHRWNMALQGGPWKIDLGKLAGFPADQPYRLVRTDQGGRLLAELSAPAAAAARTLELLPTARGEIQLYAVLLNRTPEDVLIFPDGGDLSETETIRLSIGQGTAALAGEASALTIRYTLNGTEPSAASAEYTAPLTLRHGATLRAAAFSRNATTPVASTTSATFRVVRTLLDTGIIRGADDIRPVRVPLAGVKELRIRVTDGEDGLDYDTCNIADPWLRALAPTATDDRLTSLIPLTAVQGNGPPDYNLPQLAIGAKPYQYGITTHPLAYFAYEVAGRYRALEADLGLDRRTKGKGSVRFIFTGVF